MDARHVAVAAALVAVGISGTWFGVEYFCGGKQVEASEPGEPMGEERCVRGELAMPATLMIGSVLGLLAAFAWPRTARMGLAIALIAGLPVATFAVASVANEVPQFFDPCMHWGQGQSGSLSPSADCPRVSGTSETKTGAAIRLLLIQGGLLTAVVVGFLGAFRSRPILCVVAASMLFVESVPLVFGGLAVFTLLSGCLFLVASRQLNGVEPGTLRVARFVGVLAGLAATWVIGSTLFEMAKARTVEEPLFLVFVGLLTAPLVIMALVPWWPKKPLPAPGPAHAT